MSRKIGWSLTIVYNFFRMPLIWMFNFGRFKFSLIEIVSPKALFKISRDGIVEIGKKCVIEDGSLLRSSGGKVKIGNKVYINRNCNIVAKENIFIDDGTTLGPNIAIYDHNHNFGKSKNVGYKSAPIIIGKNVWIGTGVIILKGANIGDNCVIGAGNIISGVIPENTLVMQDRNTKYINIE